MMDTNYYAKKYFSIIGDSISTFEGCSQPEYAAYYDTSRKLENEIFKLSDTWWGMVIEHLGGELLVNNSFSGSTVCWHPQYDIQSYGCSDERTSGLGKDDILPDVIIVFMGMNDWGRGMSISSPDENTEDISSFSIAYMKMIERLKSNYPSSEIWCLTLPVSTCRRRYNFTFPYLYGGIHIEKYCNSIKECAERCGVRCIDIYDPLNPYDTVDCFHPTADGMKSIANAVIKRL